MTKFIFFTGGVVSSVGKGVTAAALGRLLKARGLQVAVQKLDPYINVDPGTMSPYQHGEVFVTEDGAETDLDLGHYERFIDINLSQASNVTTGRVYAEVIARERRGDYLGGTIQVIPHITDEIKRYIHLIARQSEADVVLVEVGGTVGDIESLPFMEALRQMRSDVGQDNTLYVHVTFLPHVGASSELKTKPTQHSVRELRGIGIQPDVIIARADHPIPHEHLQKIALFCNVEERAVIPAPTSDILYSIPLLLHQAGLDSFVVERLKLETVTRPDMLEWQQMIEEIRQPKPTIRLGIVGKYVELHDAYMSVREALYHAGVANNRQVEIEWIHSGDLEKGKGWEQFEGLDGVVVPGGFGERGIEGKIKTARWARENKVPYLGLCLGMQVMCIDLARQIIGSDEANSTEFDSQTEMPIISLMADQHDLSNMGGTMRLGAYPCVLKPGTKAYEAYRVERVDERHRHRWEFNNKYREIMQKNGLVLSGLSPDGRLVEIAELRDHPFMLGSQFHPEFKSRPNRPHPLFKAFVAAAVKRQEASQNARQKAGKNGKAPGVKVMAEG
ncbi:MAG: CTP synthase [Chloroflexi bacterium]|nr:CTP synthase [Ardenticatenaceae bacterium]MBL1128628.1 CTP synthase [Chloroflexota bacterium]NOG34706.1 CTP synthase [Chloroflexota bacterium]GIK55083.1 MAG: CTP synthase [Chloroflexota bacterium]